MLHVDCASLLLAVPSLACLHHITHCGSPAANTHCSSTSVGSLGAAAQLVSLCSTQAEYEVVSGTWWLPSPSCPRSTALEQWTAGPPVVLKGWSALKAGYCRASTCMLMQASGSSWHPHSSGLRWYISAVCQLASRKSPTAEPAVEAMLPKGAFLKVVDNTGARLGQIIWTRFGTAGTGNVVKLAIKDAKGGKVMKGQMKKAVVLETKYPTRRPNGAHYQSLRNTCLLVSDKGTPMGNRVRSMLGFEFNRPRWKRISLLGKRLF